MLKEGNQRRGDAHDLVRSDIHVVDVLVISDNELLTVTAGVAAQELIVFVQRRVCLGDNEFVFGVGRQILILVGHKRPNKHILNAKVADFFRHFFCDPRFSLENYLTG